MLEFFLQKSFYMAMSTYKSLAKCLGLQMVQMLHGNLCSVGGATD